MLDYQTNNDMDEAHLHCPAMANCWLMMITKIVYDNNDIIKPANM